MPLWFARAASAFLGLTSYVETGLLKVHGMARGGARPNSGPKPRAYRAAQDREVTNALSVKWTPLAVMLEAMRREVSADNWPEAAKHAKEAAPYVHPKLAAVEHSGEVALLHEAALDALDDEPGASHSPSSS